MTDNNSTAMETAKLTLCEMPLVDQLYKMARPGAANHMSAFTSYYFSTLNRQR